MQSFSSIFLKYDYDKVQTDPEIKIFVDMKKTSVRVPKGIRFLGDWEEFKFSNFSEKCIIDKKLPGCGFTEYCINGPENVILCSPRKILLKNKYDQHQDDVYLVKNEYETTINYDKNLERPDKSKLGYVVINPTSEQAKELYKRIYDEIKAYSELRSFSDKPIKILVTYDSFHIVKDILEHLEIFKTFRVVIDEFQTILHDAKFKSTTELDFLDTLGDSHSSIFTSATPMMEKYLDMLDEFKDLPYYELDWKTEDPNRLVEPDINPLTMKSVGTKCEEIIERYKSGKFEKTTIKTDSGEIKDIYSTEAVFYVNSVNHIINVINKCNLQPEEINILCSDTEYNKSKLKARLKVKGHSIGTVPLKGEANKMFTFCTRTVYLGADFWSKCARSFVFSDANINTLVVDVSEDLAQIMGRQRDVDNPWHNSANFYIITSRNTEQDVFQENLARKMKSTDSLLRSYDLVSEEDKLELSKAYDYIAKTANYQDNYVAITKGKPVLNKLVVIAEQRSYELQTIEHKDRFSVFNKLNEVFGTEIVETDEITDIEIDYRELTTNPAKLKYLCNISTDLMYKFINKKLPVSDPIRSVLSILSQKKVVALGYNMYKINNEIEKERGLTNITSSIYSIFNEGDSYSNTYIIEKLQSLYDNSCLNVKAKATDIKRWFEVKSLMLQDKEQGKRVNGVKIIKKL